MNIVPPCHTQQIHNKRGSKSELQYFMLML